MKKQNIKLSKALTWDDLADEYEKQAGNSARILPMDSIFDWAVRQKSRFSVSKEGTIHKKLT